MSAPAPAVVAGGRVVRRAPSLRASSFALEELDVAGADGTVARLVRKDLSPQRMLPEARRVRPAFLFDARREAALYRSVLRPADHGTARCLRVEAPEAAPALVLERVAGAPLEEVAYGDAWLDTARWLGRFHAEFSGGPPPVPSLLGYDTAFFSQWPGRAAALVAPADRRGAEWLVDLDRRYQPVAALLVSQPRTLVHGDFHPSNIVVAGSGRICVLDWELAGWGPALLDLAALTSGRWAAPRRAAMVRAYRRAMQEAGAAMGTPEALEACRLHLALQWLGWGPGWSPEGRRRDDWLQVARRSADRLGM